MSVQQVIADAIRQRIGLRVNYKGTLRDVCPHRIGSKRAQPPPKKYTTRIKDPRKYQNHINVFVYQFGGYSSSGLAPDGSPDNWRCWALEDIYDANPIPIQRWHTSQSWGVSYSGCIDDQIAGV